MPKTFHSTVALQEGFLKHLEEIATVLLDLGSHCFLFLHVIPDRLDDGEIRSCQTPCAYKNLIGLLPLMATGMFGNIN